MTVLRNKQLEKFFKKWNISFPAMDSMYHAEKDNKHWHSV